ncbi:hypothetical protein [uncultured Helicobacter sp.]|uniref:hypothetical protein n=1 Tax=uncultured Helicobacter sp. TaxID=175537 RepID=UPI00262DCDA2|nr:hypothetical protein [uncultured Helicobacter sp.]
MKLDVLQNPNLEDNAFLLSSSTQNIPPISQNIFKRNQRELESLSEYFGGESGGNFSFLSGAFLELFLSLHTCGHKIALALSNHQQAYDAYKLIKNFIPITPILPSTQSGIIESIEEFNQCDVFIIPLVNQDLLTLNPIEKLMEQREDAIFIIDISYGVRFSLTPKLTSKTIFLCEAESFGFLRGNGVFLSYKEYLPYFPRTRYVDHLYVKLLERIKSCSTPLKDHKEEFFSLFQDSNISLFAPLSNSLTNTLALRFKGIKARNLLQNLVLEDIEAINGQECLFGFFSPSFVLQEMGYSELEARELLSVSFTHFDPKIAKILEKHYIQLKTLEI